MGEIWKDIECFEGLYQVSNLGSVKSLSRTHLCLGGTRTKKEIILKNIIKKGYASVTLCKNSKSYQCLVHRLVWETFNYKTDLEIDHIIEGNKLDNRLSNLQAISSRENTSKHKLTKNKSSKYTGVSKRTNRNKFVVYATLNGNKKYIGDFYNEEDASNAYINAIGIKNNK